jgi:hypothetical protein
MPPMSLSAKTHLWELILRYYDTFSFITPKTVVTGDSTEEELFDELAHIERTIDKYVATKLD